jgi:arylformamidase
MDAEAEYNNRARVGDSAALIAAWGARAAAFRAAHPPQTLAHGPGAREVMDLFRPADRTDPPWAIFFHGGYWQALDGRAVSHVAAGLLARGVGVAIPSYDLCPAVPLERIVAQAEAAAALLAARTGRLPLAMGHSAGGHLAALLLARGLAGAALPISGVFWLEPLVGTSINAALGLDAAAARALSPGLLPAPGLLAAPGRPLHAVVGGDESAEFIRQSRDFAAAWGGGFEALPGLNHFTVLDPLGDPAHPLVGRAAALARAAAGGVTQPDGE